MSEYHPEFITLDIETDIKNRGDEAVGTFKASPYNSANKIIMVGAKHCDVSAVQVWGGMSNSLESMPTPGEETVVVGHNLAFDLAYMYRDYEAWYDWSAKGMIWDTMLVDYLLSGQERKFTSLNAVSEAVGGTIKDKRIEEYWENNVDTGDIPEEELKEYLIHDVKNTERVFLRQVKQVTERSMMPLVRTMMEARMATLEMEINGMYVDRTILGEQSHDLQKRLDAVNDIIFRGIRGAFPADSWGSLNIKSTSVISAWLFGGTFKYKVREEMFDPDDLSTPLKYKSGAKKGEVKLKWVEKSVEIIGKFSPSEYSTKGAKTWATGEAVLKKIVKHYAKTATPLTAPVSVVTAMLKARAMNKDMSAYYVGYNKLIWPNGLLHPSYHHCSTDTGRLSCSKPNLQQASGKDDE